MYKYFKIFNNFRQIIVRKENYLQQFPQIYRFQANLIDGKQIANDILNELKFEINEWTKLGNRSPNLIAIQVGEDGASSTYIKNKMEAAIKVGIKSETCKLPSTTTEKELIKIINDFNKDTNVDGILVQLPVPNHICERNICNAVDQSKDVDGFNMINIGKLVLNDETIVPATALGVIELIKRTKIETFGKNIVVCGRSKNVGLPIMLLLHSDHRNELPGFEATVTLCHRNTPTEQLTYFTKNADIIISATGVVNLIKPEMIKSGACIIDVGLTRIQTNDGKFKLVGDVDFKGVSKIAGHITPVPGGVGPMTVAMLMVNTFKVAKNLRKNM